MADQVRAAAPGEVDSSFIQVSHLHKTFGDGDESLEVLKDVDLAITQGEFVCVVGESGCGKSTLLRAIAGIDPDHGGSVTVDGEEVLGPARRRGMVFQESRLFPWMTVEKNIGFALSGVPAREKAIRVQDHIDLVGLTGFETAYPSQLSGGMAQRVSIARALINRPEVLLLDEPFGALDAFTKIRMQRELYRIKEQEHMTMVLVTHDIEEAVFLGDRVVIMSAKPGVIRTVMQDDLPRPRNRNSYEFTRIKKQVYDQFFDDPQPEMDYMI